MKGEISSCFSRIPSYSIFPTYSFIFPTYSFLFPTYSFIFSLIASYLLDLLIPSYFDIFIFFFIMPYRLLENFSKSDRREGGFAIFHLGVDEGSEVTCRL